MADRMTPDWAAPASSTGRREHDLLLEDLYAEIAAYRDRLAATENAVGALRAGEEPIAGDTLARAVHRFHEYAAQRLAALAACPAGRRPGGQASPGSGPRPHPSN